MTPATSKVSTQRAIDAEGDFHYRLLGIAIISLFPALFWTGILATVGVAVGHAPAPLTLATVGAAIATILFMSVSALYSRAG